MNAGAPFTASADPAREIPDGAAARQDRIDAALASLENESRRLERLGFETPLARLSVQRRYWQFLRGVFAVADSSGPRAEAGR